jgi:signal peptidase II
LSRELRPFLLAALAVVGLDLATKLLVYDTLPLGQTSRLLLGDWVRLTYIHNAGAAFGLFQGSRWFFVGVSVLSGVILCALALSGRYRDPWILAAFGLILGGALGNLIDRLWLGVVIDFIDVGIGARRWPVFNVADMGVTVGVGLLALRLLFFEDRNRAGADLPSAGAPLTPPEGREAPGAGPRG